MSGTTPKSNGEDTPLEAGAWEGAKPDLASLLPEELRGIMESLGEPAYRGDQIFKWMHNKRLGSFAEMTDLSLRLRSRLEDEYSLSSAPVVLEKIKSKDRQTTKCLLELDKGTIIESVGMRHDYGRAVCVSTQAGCAMGCAFCASAIGGLDRSLSPGEMCGQVYVLGKALGDATHVVLMGSGEPLANYSNVVKFIRIVTHPLGLGISARRTTLSTCGLPEGIEKLSKEGLALTLAVSLHASNDEARARLMPQASKACSLKELAGVCRRYAQATKRRITYEYAMIKGVNDSLADARELAGLVAGDLCHVNLIPLNGCQLWERSPAKAIEAFASALEARGIAATVRRSFGGGVEAACGQLRNRRK
jgi:23S rRNA (adenine2503-C2)-methyltransferase